MKKIFAANSHTLHRIMVESGLIFKVQDRKPYILYNEETGIGFMPAINYIADGLVVILPHFSTPWYDLYLEDWDERKIHSSLGLAFTLRYFKRIAKALK